MITTGSHFSGYGSYLFALDSLGINYKSLFACDIDKYAKQTYLANHHTETFYQDVTADEVQNAPYVDLFVSSPPCQSFSIAGNRGGISDDRGILFKYSHQYIKNKRPRFFIIENVKGLLSSEGGNTFQTWLQMLGSFVNGAGIQASMFDDVTKDTAGYFLRWFVLNAKTHGHPEPVPQNRERVFIVGFRDSEDYKKYKEPKKKKLTKKLYDLLDKYGFENFIMSESFTNRLIKRISKNHSFGSNISNDIAATICSGHYTKNSSDANYIRLSSNTKKGFTEAFPGDGVRLGNVNTKTGIGRRQKNVSPALLVGEQIGTVTEDLKLRKLTPNECRKLMGLPESFVQPCSNSQAYKQYGNSIVVNCLAAIIKNMNIEIQA